MTTLSLLKTQCVFRNISLRQTKHTRWPAVHTHTQTTISHLKWWAILACMPLILTVTEINMLTV